MFRLVVETPRRVITQDSEAQTELHLYSTKIDKNYMWNVWDLRRQAILLVSNSIDYENNKSCSLYCKTSN